LSERSTLDEEFERLRLEVWFVVMLALIELRERSTLDDEFERLRLEV
jgi:cell division protein FtsL